MGRMDRYKHIHEESKEKKNIFARKEINPHEQKTQKSQDNEFDNGFDESFTTDERREPEYHYQQTPPQPQQTGWKKQKKQKKPKKRKKHPILGWIIKIILILVIYSGVSFAAGKMVADKDQSISDGESETFNGFKSQDGANNILLLGSDSREGENARADTVMVLQLDGPSKKPKLLSFMRDTYVEIPGVGNNKLNAAYAYGGAELVRKTLAQNFGIETKYYTIVDFKSFEKVIDTLFPGGVQITAEKDMSKNLEVPIKKGPQKMNGLTLLQYARFRMDEEGDFGRVRRQQQVMNAIFSELKNPIALAKLPYAAGKVMGYAATDLPMSFLLKNSLSMAKGAGGIDRLTVPVEDSWSYGNTWDAGSVLMVDQEMNKKAINEFLNK